MNMDEFLEKYKKERQVYFLKAWRRLQKLFKEAGYTLRNSCRDIPKLPLLISEKDFDSMQDRIREGALKRKIIQSEDDRKENGKTPNDKEFDHVMLILPYLYQKYNEEIGLNKSEKIFEEAGIEKEQPSEVPLEGKVEVQKDQPLSFVKEIIESKKPEEKTSEIPPKVFSETKHSLGRAFVIEPEEKKPEPKKPARRPIRKPEEKKLSYAEKLEKIYDTKPTGTAPTDWKNWKPAEGKRTGRKR